MALIHLLVYYHQLAYLLYTRRHAPRKITIHVIIKVPCKFNVFSDIAITTLRLSETILFDFYVALDA